MMKTTKNIFIAGLAALAITFTISSCQKKFDPKTYAPKKPAPSFGGYSSSSQIEPSSLVAFWSLDGTLTDSISGSTGIATGTSFGTGIKGQAFQGALNSYAVCKAPAALAGLQSFTSSIWVNTTPPTAGLLDYFTLANTKTFWGNIEMFFDNGSTNADAHVRIHLSQNGNDNTYAAEVPNLFNGWVNLVFTYNQAGGVCTLYVNGASASSGTAGSLTGPLTFTNVGNVVFGCTQFNTVPTQTSGGPTDGSGNPTVPSWSGYFTGKIYHARIYNKVLTAQQVSALYNLENLGR